MKSKSVISIIAVSIVISSVSITSGKLVNKESFTNDSTELKSEDVEYYGLIIGIEKFVDPEFNNLTREEDRIDDDAIAMYNLLLNSINWKEENIKLMLNENATKDKIKEAIEEWLGNNADENDVVLIYYITHGGKIRLKNRRKGHATICTYNQTMEYKLEDRITDKEFDSYVNKIKSKNIAIILSSCYSGRMLALKERGRVVLTAAGGFFFCGVDQDNDLGGEMFSYFLRIGLKGVADLNNDGWVTAEEAFYYARLPTIHHSIWRQFPFIIKWNNQSVIWFFQVPRMFDRYLGSLKIYQYQKN